MQIKWKTNQGYKTSQIKCKFSVHYLVYNNYKIILEAAFGRGSRESRILRILKLLQERI